MVLVRNTMPIPIPTTCTRQPLRQAATHGQSNGAGTILGTDAGNILQNIPVERCIFHRQPVLEVAEAEEEMAEMEVILHL